MRRIPFKGWVVALVVVLLWNLLVYVPLFVSAPSPPPLGAPGLALHDRLTEIEAAIERVAQKGGPHAAWPVTATPERRADGDSRALAGHPGRLRRGVARGAPAGECRQRGRERGADGV